MEKEITYLPPDLGHMSRCGFVVDESLFTDPRCPSRAMQKKMLFNSIYLAVRLFRQSEL